MGTSEHRAWQLEYEARLRKIDERQSKLDTAYASLLRDWGVMTKVLDELRASVDELVPAVRKMRQADELATARLDWEREQRTSREHTGQLHLSRLQTFVVVGTMLAAWAGIVLSAVRL